MTGLVLLALVAGFVLGGIAGELGLLALLATLHTLGEEPTDA